jgi:hypothetical protein
MIKKVVDFHFTAISSPYLFTRRTLHNGTKNVGFVFIFGNILQ